MVAWPATDVITQFSGLPGQLPGHVVEDDHGVFGREADLLHEAFDVSRLYFRIASAVTDPHGHAKIVQPAARSLHVRVKRGDVVEGASLTCAGPISNE